LILFLLGDPSCKILRDRLSPGSAEVYLMSQAFSENIAKLIHERMATGRYASEDELLRTALEALAEEEGDLEAIQQAIDEMEAGDEGVPLDEAIAAIRRKRNLA